MPTALDNGIWSPRKLLRKVVARLLGSKPYLADEAVYERVEEPRVDGDRSPFSRRVAPTSTYRFAAGFLTSWCGPGVVSSPAWRGIVVADAPAPAL